MKDSRQIITSVFQENYSGTSGIQQVLTIIIKYPIDHIQISFRFYIFGIYTHHLIQMVYRLRCLPHGVIHHTQLLQHEFPFSFILF